MTNMVLDNTLLEKELGSGGEAKVYKIKNNKVAKIYHSHRKAPEEKLNHMIQNPPNSSGLHLELAWPQGFVKKPNGLICGYYMSEVAGAKEIHNLYNPKARKKYFPYFNWKDIHHIAINLTKAVISVHEKNYIIGDFNESNILVHNDGLITIIDTDSFQVTCASGQIHRCPVGKVEFTPPELQGANLSKINREKEHDLFGLGVLLFQLLMNGSHPFRGKEGPPETGSRIKAGLFPFGADGKGGKPDVPFENLDPKLRILFERCFTHAHINPVKRPTAKDWKEALEKAKENLRVCKNDPHHHYNGNNCPHCNVKKLPVKPPGPRQTTVGASTRTKTLQNGSQGLGWKKDFIFCLLTLIGAFSLIFIGSAVGSWFQKMQITYLFWCLAGCAHIVVLRMQNILSDGEFLSSVFTWFFGFYFIRLGYFLYFSLFSELENPFLLHYCYLIGVIFATNILHLLYKSLKARLFLTVSTLTTLTLIFLPAYFLDPQSFFGLHNQGRSPSLIQEQQSKEIIEKESFEANEIEAIAETIDNVPDKKLNLLSPADKVPDEESSLLTPAIQPKVTKTPEYKSLEAEFINSLNSGDIEGAMKILDSGLENSNYIDVLGNSILINIIQNGDNQLLQKFCDEGSDINPNYQNQHGKTAIMIAASQGKFDKVHILLTHLKPDIELVDNQGHTVYDIAKIAKKKQGKFKFKKRKPYKNILKCLKQYKRGSLKKSAPQ